MVPSFVDANPYARGIVPNIQRLADRLRSAGGTVAWVLPARTERTEVDDEFHGPEAAEMFRNSGGTGPLPDRLWHGSTLGTDDLLVEKSAPSAFFPGRCPLPELLRDRGQHGSDHRHSHQRVLRVFSPRRLDPRYQPGVRGWFKVRRRDTTEAIIGGVTGTLTRPQLLVLGRYDADGLLRAVGRTTPLKPTAASELADRLPPPAPSTRGPASGSPPPGAAVSREPLVPILVVPDLVAEINAGTAIDRGAFRHPLSFVRLRLDVPVA